MSDHVAFTADHLTVTTLESPDTAARSYVDVMNAFGFELAGAANVVDVVRVATVNNDVAGANHLGELMENRIDQSSGYHQPNRARRLELRDETVQRCGADCAFVDERLDRVGTAIVHHALVATTQEATHHIGAHSPQSNHSNLHSKSSLLSIPLSLKITE